MLTYCSFNESAGRRPRAVVAVPVRDEAERIGACLAALERQEDRCGRRLEPGCFGVVLVLNNCADATDRIVRSLAPGLSYPLRLVEVELPAEAANAGTARAIAMNAAADWLDSAGRTDAVILTTDADSVPPPGWIDANLAEIDRGADAVAGSPALDPIEAAGLPASLRRRVRLETLYERLLVEVAARLDPRPHDPWPNHWAASGASLAVTLAAYRLIGGLPGVPSGEDQALIAALESRDARVRHPPGLSVITSGRLEGRARGGFADTIRTRCHQPGAACDEKLEAAAAALVRYAIRGRLRAQHAAGTWDAAEWAVRLRLDVGTVAAAMRQPCFGAGWARIEAASPLLTTVALKPGQLPVQIAAAWCALSVLRAPGSIMSLAARRADGATSAAGRRALRAAVQTR